MIPIVISKELFDELLRHAPEGLRQEVKDNAERAISGLCFTEADIIEKGEEYDGWEDLTAIEKEKLITTILDADFSHITEQANIEIAEAVIDFIGPGEVEDD
ncbi:MAG: hypothetical protein AB7U82_01085 [Blastocatellales bacterium]